MDKATLKALADKHTQNTTKGQIDEALRYIANIESGIRAELEKLNDEFETLMSHSDKPEYRERIENNYIHWRHILVSVVEPLQDARHHWQYHAGTRKDKPRHMSTY
ncbi:hypothetical protein IOL78_003837 [Salmonella enterica]|nr:hypothetical protein [Salmonella enterica]EII4381912.1 hypothetical protein [Salmonella enterica]